MSDDDESRDYQIYDERVGEKRKHQRREKRDRRDLLRWEEKKSRRDVKERRKTSDMVWDKSDKK